MIQQDERFSKLLIPVHKFNAKTSVELFDLLPGLRRYFQRIASDVKPDGELPPGYRACWSGPALVSIIKYIMFVYDPDSDLAYEYADDPKLLKDAAAREAGFRRTKGEGEWPEWVLDIMEFRDRQVVDWILDYLRIRNNKIWTQIKFIEEEIEFLNRSRATALLEGKLRSDAMDQTKTRSEELQILYKKFYSIHNDLKKETEKEIFPITPENVYKELEVPEEYWKVRQIKDVPTEARPQ